MIRFHVTYQFLTKPLRRFLFCGVVLASLVETSFAQSSPEDFGVTSIKMKRIARIQNRSALEPVATDLQDREIYSPKSVRFSADGKKIYINSLEGGKTVVYAWPSLEKLKTIHHQFKSSDAGLFNNESTIFDYQYFSQSPAVDPNIFVGKPVESELSHGGKWLWIPYYRRNFDRSGQSPSAVAIVDTETDTIVRVMPTGPIPKYVVASPDGRYMAVVHWGDNTIGIIDTHTGVPSDFTYIAHLKVEAQLPQNNLEGTDRDATCGFCLRGSVFSPDGEYLLVARMGKGGIAGFHIPSRTYLGSIMNIRSTPRHLVLSPDGEYLYSSSNQSGYVSKIPLQEALEELKQAQGKRVRGPTWQEVSVGKGARTLDITRDGRLLFVAVNGSSQLVAVDAKSLTVISKLKVDNYAVGLAVSPDDKAVILTSQGRGGVGGNSVNIVAVEYEVPINPTR